jgi:hypothetical protein
LRDVLERDPHQLAAMFNLAVLYSDYLGKPDKARTLVDQFLSEAPDKHPSRPAAEKLKADIGASAKPDAPPAPAAKTPASKGRATAGKAKKK